MQKFWIKSALLASLVAAIPVTIPAASAKGWDGDRREWRDAHPAALCDDGRFQRLDRKIERSARSGAISWTQARRLAFDLRDIRADAYHICANGLRPREARYIDDRYDRIAWRIERAADRNYAWHR